MHHLYFSPRYKKIRTAISIFLCVLIYSFGTTQNCDIPLKSALDAANCNKNSVTNSLPGANLINGDCNNEFMINQSALTGNGAPAQDFETSFDGGDSKVADDIQINTPSHFVSIQIFGSAGTNVNVPFNFCLYSDNAGVPGNIIYTQTTNVSIANGDFSFILDLTNCPLLSPGKYWVAGQVIANFGTIGQFFWSTSTANQGGSHWLGTHAPAQTTDNDEFGCPLFFNNPGQWNNLATGCGFAGGTGPGLAFIANFCKANLACPLTCNDKVYASMPAEICARTFEPADFLKGNTATCDASSFQVILAHPFGTNTPGEASVDRSHLGYTMVYKVMDASTGNSCWGYVTVEDKVGPAVPCKSTTISCWQLDAINKITRETEDQCSDGGSVIAKITWKEYGCDSVGKLGIVIRDIQSSDVWGNGNKCTDTLTIKKNVLDSVCCASNLELPCRFYCLNGTKVLTQGDPTNPLSIFQFLNVKFWDLVQLSNDPKSPNYPTPQLLQKLQGKGDPLVELGLLPARWAGTKLLLDNLILPNEIVNNDQVFCIQPDSLVVPYMNDSVLDLRKTIKELSIDRQNGYFKVNEYINEEYCTQSLDKTPMYGNESNGICKIVVTYHDEVFNICGSGFKIRREWILKDWCTGEEKVCVQYIKVEDKVDPSPVISGSPSAPGPISSIVSGLKDTVGYFRSVRAHDCYAYFNINPMNVWDCSDVEQTYTFVYKDPGHPGKTIVESRKLGASGAPIKLPVGIHIGKMSLVDECWNSCNFPLVVLVEDMTPPNPTCDEETQVTIDPATCWARVYAKDLDNGSRDNCCTNLHFAVANMDSVEHYRKAYHDHLKKICGWEHYNQMKQAFDFIVEEYISAYVFADYIDLTECGNNQIILRVFDNCNTALYDPHITKLSEHKWYMAQVYGLYFIYHHSFDPTKGFLKLLEKELNRSAAAQLDTFKARRITHEDCEELAALKLLSVFRQFVRQFVPGLIPLDENNPNFTVIIDLIEGIEEEGIGSFCIPEFKVKFPFNLEALQKYLEENADRDITAALAETDLIPFVLGLCKSIYNDCMIQIRVDDKTPPIAETPDELFWYCDNVGTDKNNELEYAHLACDDAGEYTGNKSCADQGGIYNRIEAIKEDEKDGGSLDWVDGVGKAYGYYGCKSVGLGHTDTPEHGEIELPCTNTMIIRQGLGNVSAENLDLQEHNNYWSPIYCRAWLVLDKTDQAGKVNVTSYFAKPWLVSYGTGDGKATPAPGYPATKPKGHFEVSDNCWINPTFEVKTDSFIDKCGNGWYKRTWVFSDKCQAGTVKVEQKIVTKHRSDFEVLFPEDVVQTCEGDNIHPDVTGRPMIMDDECELVGVNYKDDRYDIVADACYKIVRTWTIIDWCKYDPNQHDRHPDVIVNDTLVASRTDRYCAYRNLKDNGDGYMQYIQVIKIVDNVAPITACKDTTVCYYGGYSGAGNETDPMCTVPSYSSPLFTATDNCTPANQISFRWEIDYLNNGSIDKRSGPNASRFTSSDLTDGKHKLYVIAEDNCGNEDTATCIITILDCKKPTPYCYNGIATVVMPSSKEVTVWAKDLDAGSFDNCTKKKDLKFSFDGKDSATSKTFTCAHIPNGVSATVEVDIYVTDATGNTDFCRTYLLIQDNTGNVCPDNAAIAASISGKIVTETTEPIENVVLEVKSSNAIPAFKTASNGGYAFNGLSMKGDYSITPKRDDDPTNGVSTVDLVLIQKHILGVEPLNSAYKVIAADADRSNDVSAVDLVELRKLVLTVYDKLPNNSSWRFVPKSYNFSNIQAPWGFPEKLDINGLSKDEIARDFVGIKVGDVNGNVVPHSLLGAEAREVGGTLKFKTLDRALKADEEAVVEFTAENFNNIEGYQFSMSLRGLELKSVKGGKLQVSENNFGMTKLGVGYLTTSWNDSKAISVSKNDVLFSITVKATKATKLSESLVINSKYTRAEAYNGQENLGVSLEIGKKAVAGYVLHQNTPNPFKSTTMISYELAKSENVTIKITDVTGKLIRSYQRDGQKGYNQLTINRSDISGAGVLYYTVETKEFSATKKMVLVE